MNQATKENHAIQMNQDPEENQLPQMNQLLKEIHSI